MINKMESMSWLVPNICLSPLLRTPITRKEQTDNISGGVLVEKRLQPRIPSDFNMAHLAPKISNGHSQRPHTAVYLQTRRRRLASAVANAEAEARFCVGLKCPRAGRPTCTGLRRVLFAVPRSCLLRGQVFLQTNTQISIWSWLRFLCCGHHHMHL